MSEKICFSLDGETFDDDIDYVAQELEGDPEIGTVYIGELVKQYNHQFLNVSYLIENMQEQAYELGEFTETYLEDITDEKRKDLEKVILDWFEDNNIEPSFFLVKNSKEISKEEFFEKYYN